MTKNRDRLRNCSHKLLELLQSCDNILREYICKQIGKNYTMSLSNMGKYFPNQTGEYSINLILL